MSTRARVICHGSSSTVGWRRKQKGEVDGFFSLLGSSKAGGKARTGSSV